MWKGTLQAHGCQKESCSMGQAMYRFLGEQGSITLDFLLDQNRRFEKRILASVHVPNLKPSQLLEAQQNTGACDTSNCRTCSFLFSAFQFVIARTHPLLKSADMAKETNIYGPLTNPRFQQ